MSPSVTVGGIKSDAACLLPTLCFPATSTTWYPPIRSGLLLWGQQNDARRSTSKFVRVSSCDPTIFFFKKDSIEAYPLQYAISQLRSSVQEESSIAKCYASLMRGSIQQTAPSILATSYTMHRISIGRLSSSSSSTDQGRQLR